MRKMFKKISKVARNIIRAIKKYLVFNNKNNYFTFKYMKNLYLLNKNHYVDKKIYLANFHKDTINILFEQSLDFKPEIFIDIGANLGLFSIGFAREFEDVEIHALEPDPKTLSQFYANRFINGFNDRITIHQIAASDRNGQVHLTQDFSNPGKNSLIESSAYDEDRVVPVSCCRLDTLFNFKNRRIAAKIDVEGHELAVIAGMPDLLADNAWLILVESFPDKRTRMQETLIGKGFRYITQYDDDHLLIKPEGIH